MDVKLQCVDTLPSAGEVRSSDLSPSESAPGATRPRPVGPISHQRVVGACGSGSLAATAAVGLPRRALPAAIECWAGRGGGHLPLARIT